MPIPDNDAEQRLILASRAFARCEGARRVVMIAAERSRVMAWLRQASWVALPWPLRRYAVGVMLAAAATTHVLLTTATGHLLGWTALIIPAVVLLIGLAAMATSPHTADDRSPE